MSSFCNNICQRYRALMPKNSGRYSLGQNDVMNVKSIFFGMGYFVLVAIIDYD